MEDIAPTVKLFPLGSHSLVNLRSHRAARFYWGGEEPEPQPIHDRLSSSLENNSPVVIAAIAAGLVGVTLIIFIILSIWIKNRISSLSSPNPNSANDGSNETIEKISHDDSTTIVLENISTDPKNSCADISINCESVETNNEIVPDSENKTDDADV